MKRPDWYENLDDTFGGSLLKGVINLVLLFLLVIASGVTLGAIGYLVVISWPWLQWVVLGICLLVLIFMASFMFD